MKHHQHSMPLPDDPMQKGIASLSFSQRDMEHPLFKRIVAALQQELATMRMQNDDAADIASTTLLRGEIRCVKRILARTEEVGPESRQSEFVEEIDRPESAFGAHAARVFRGY